MELAVWIVSGTLAAAYVFIGGSKIVAPKSAAALRQRWAQVASPATIRGIGILELAGAMGLVLPRLTHIAEVLTPIAAGCLVLFQVVAALVHLRTNEVSRLPINILFVAAAGFVLLAGVFLA